MGAHGAHKRKRPYDDVALIIAIVAGYGCQVIIGSKINLQNKNKNLISNLSHIQFEPSIAETIWNTFGIKSPRSNVLKDAV